MPGENDIRFGVAGDEMAAALPGDQAAAWALRATLEALRRRVDAESRRALEARMMLDAATAAVDATERQMRDVTRALTLLAGHRDDT